MSTELIVHEVEEIPYRLAPLPTPTPKASASLNSQEYARHVARLIAAVKATLRQYWVPNNDDVVDHIEMEDWTDALEDWPLDEIRRALRQWVCANPRRRPNYGDILQILKRDRGHAWVAQLRQLPAPTEQLRLERLEHRDADIATSH